MAFVTAKQWVCNMCGRQQPASEDPPTGWLHVKWWRTDGQVYEIDICGPRCANQAERLLNKTLSAAVKPSESL